MVQPHQSPITSHRFTPHGTSCTSCLSRKDKDHFVRLLHQHAPALAPPPARPPFETASLSAGVPAAFPAPSQNPAISAPEALQHVPQRWRPLRSHSAGDDAAAPVEVPSTLEAALPPAGSARDTNTESFRCRSAPSYLQTE